jgi:copper(I)-binding protein
MRPAAAGAPNALAYVDLISDAPVELIGAATPVARLVEIVVVDREQKSGAAKVVPALPLPAYQLVRLPYLGSHLRLIDIGKPVNTGDKVPMTLSFRISGGQVIRQTVAFDVRGVLPPPGAKGNEPASYQLPPPVDSPNQVPVAPPTK